MALYYVDFENVHFDGLKGIERLNIEDQVLIYCRESDVKAIRRGLRKTKASIKCCIVNDFSKNVSGF